MAGNESGETEIGKGRRSRPMRPGPSGPLYAESLPPAAFPGASSPLALRQENSSPGPQRANRLENNNKQFAPVTWKSQRELPGIRKPAAVRKNEFTHFLRPDAGFRCALCAQHASEAGCPEAVDCVIQVTAGSCLLLMLRSFRHWRGLGCNLHPSGVWGNAPSYPSPVIFLFFNVSL